MWDFRYVLIMADVDIDKCSEAIDNISLKCDCGENHKTDIHHKDENTKPKVRKKSVDESIEEVAATSDEVDEELDKCDWLEKDKHIFILSEAGKPIYSR